MLSAVTAPRFVGGMRGEISPVWSGFSGGHGFIWLVQCIGCVAESVRAQHVWLATTTDGGASWRVAPRRRVIGGIPVWDAENGWSGGGRGGFTVTHDGGRTWTAVTVPRSPRSDWVSVAKGTVWATATRCRGPYQCVYPVLRGAASGSRLSPVSTAPGDRGDLGIIAVSTGRAYMFTPTADAGAGAGADQAWVTDDSGRTWHSVAPGCPENLATVFATVGDDDGTIWRACAPGGGGDRKVGTSTDGGHRWVYHPVPFEIRNLDPESRRVAWAQDLSGTTLRTDDGGRSWRTVWTAPKDAPRVAPTLTARSATAATEVIPVTHTQPREHRTLTNLLAYRTTDGGAHWQRMTVALPRGR